MPKINRETLNRFQLPIPPLSEQAAVVQHLDETTAIISAAIARAHRQIELLQEYRTRLISDVVTGKLGRAGCGGPASRSNRRPGPDKGDGLLTEGMDRDLFDADASGEELAMESEVTV